MGSVIVERQNEEFSVMCLAAARQLYSSAKFWFTVQIVLTALVPVFLAIIRNFYNIDYFSMAYCFSIAIANCFFGDFIARRKKEAAIIQEMFDTYVLSVKWNECMERVDHEIIRRYSKKYKKRVGNKFNALKNWYPTCIESLESEEAKVICQCSNCRYDLSLRENFSRFIYWLLFFSFLIMLILSLILDLTLRNIFIYALFPLLPIVIFFIRYLKDSRRSIKKLERMKSKTSEVWRKILQDENVDLQKTTREIQNEIYQNRENEPLIFDWFYGLFRNSLEDETHCSVSQLLGKYKDSRTQ